MRRDTLLIASMPMLLPVAQLATQQPTKCGATTFRSVLVRHTQPRRSNVDLSPILTAAAEILRGHSTRPQAAIEICSSNFFFCSAHRLPLLYPCSRAQSLADSLQLLLSISHAAGHRLLTVSPLSSSHHHHLQRSYLLDRRTAALDMPRFSEPLERRHSPSPIHQTCSNRRLRESQRFILWDIPQNFPSTLCSVAPTS